MLTAIVVIGLLIVGYVYLYNGLVSAKLKVDEGWSGITVQLKRRHELVPNLVKAARTAMNHETQLLDRIVAARTEALNALAGGAHEEINQAEGKLTAALQGFVGYAEDNPEVTVTDNIQLLQKQLEETEDQIAASRRLFNGNVQAYNTKVLSIPWNLIASRKGFTPGTMFTVDKTEMKALSKAIDIADLGMDGEPK